MGFTMKKDSGFFFFFSIYLPFATFLTALTGLVRHSSTGLSKRGHQYLFFSDFKANAFNISLFRMIFVVAVKRLLRRLKVFWSIFSLLIFFFKYSFPHLNIEKSK